MSSKSWRILSIILLFVLLVGGAATLRAQTEKPTAVELTPWAGEVQGTLALPPQARAAESPEAAILTETFEGVWPAGAWTLLDNSTADGGDYLWDDDNCWPHTGSWGAYSVGGGANGNQLPCWGPYPNNVNTWTFWGPFNLQNATAASFTFYYHGITEGGDGCPFDRFLAVYMDQDGNYNGRQWCGEWIAGQQGNDYYTWTIDMAPRLGTQQTWIAFALQSDGSDVYPGFMIDDVRVDVTTATTTCYPLTLEHSGQGGNPTASPAASSGCSSGRYVAGQTVNLTASPANGWRVANWQGTSNNGSTAATNTLIMPASAQTARVNYVRQAPGVSRALAPFILFGSINFMGPLEHEPNNSTAEANGPILLNRTYQGYPNDLSDYYSFDITSTRQVTINLTEITGKDPQLHLYHNSSANRVAYDPTPPYSIVYNATPGRYYVRVVVVDQWNSSVLYTLRVNNP